MSYIRFIDLSLLFRLDERDQLVEVQYLESCAYHTLSNLPRARAALVAAKTMANKTYVPPSVQVYRTPPPHRQGIVVSNRAVPVCRPSWISSLVCSVPPRAGTARLPSPTSLRWGIYGTCLVSLALYLGLITRKYFIISLLRIGSTRIRFNLTAWGAELIIRIRVLPFVCTYSCQQRKSYR